MNNEIKTVVELLRQGKLILSPTDGGWCIGCDATSNAAVDRINQLLPNANIVDRVLLMDSSAKLQGYFNEIPELAYDLIDMSEKPLSIILPGAKNLPVNILGFDQSIGIRITKDPFSKRLCEMFRKPVFFITVSRSNCKVASRVDEVPHTLIDQIDYVVQYGQDVYSKVVMPSIIQLGKGSLIKVIRE